MNKHRLSYHIIQGEMTSFSRWLRTRSEIGAPPSVKDIEKLTELENMLCILAPYIGEVDRVSYQFSKYPS